MGYDPNTLQSRAIEYADRMASGMRDAFGNAGNAFGNILYPSVTLNTPWVSAGATSVAMPGYSGTTAVSASAPSSQALQPVTTPAFEDAPSFLLVSPVINLPDAPASTLPTAPGAAPVFVAPDTPARPAISFPAVPVFENLNIPAAPSVNIPTFTSALPIEDITAPTEVFSYVEQEYKSAMLDALKAKLLYDLANGGYGIETADESALWERAREREMRGAAAAIQDAARQMATRGFAIPPGAMFAQMEAVRQNTMEKTSSLSREIALKRADMYVENRKFTIQQVQATEQMLITYFGYMMERALNTSKAMVELGIKVYDAKLARLKYFVERENARTQVYEVVLKAALANLEAYKSQLEGTRVAADVQRIHAEVYKTQLDGVNALVNVYRTEVEASRVKADIEQIKLQAFKAAIETYTAQVGAKQAEFSMYESQIKGEMSKVDIYKAQVGAYGAQIDAYKSKAETARVVLEAQIEPNKLLIEKYRVDIAKYSAELQASQITLQSSVAIYDAQVKAFSASASVGTKNVDASVAAGRANAEIAVAASKVVADVAIAQAHVASSAAAAIATTQAAVGSAYGAAAAGAMSSASGLVAQVSMD